MGIDIYATWSGMTDEEKEAQYSGFSTVHGHTGYLREAYHGGPYATRELLPETWDEDSYIEATEDDPNYAGIEVKGADLIRRLPRTMIAAMIREATVYGNSECRDLLMEVGIEPRSPDREPAGEVHLDKGESPMPAILNMLKEATSVKNKDSIPEPQSMPDEEWVERAVKAAPVVASIGAFVGLVLEKEIETGKPVRIVNSF